MCAHHEDTHITNNPYMKKVAWSILVMGLSLLAVIITYAWFGHIGPKFSEDILNEQQKELREKYGLAPQPVITNSTILLIPPSLRNITENNE